MTQPYRTPLDVQAVEAVLKKEFDFLTSAGYAVTITGSSRVVFSNGDLSMLFDIEPGSYALMPDIQRVSTGEGFTLYSALAGFVPMAAQYTSCAAWEVDAFTQCVQRLSAVCKQFLSPLFLGDKDAFARAAAAARESSHRYSLKCQYGATIERANKAWEEKRWEQAQELYQSAQPGLSVSEARRLKFLKSRNDESSP